MPWPVCQVGCCGWVPWRAPRPAACPQCLTVPRRLPGRAGRAHHRYQRRVLTAPWSSGGSTAFVAEAPASSVLDHLPLFTETLVVITALTHLPVTSVRDVRDDSVIAFPHGAPTVGYSSAGSGPGSLQRRRGNSPRTTDRGLVASGTGVAVMPESVLDVHAAHVQRHCLPGAHARVITPLIWRRTDTPPAVTALRQMLVELAPHADPAPTIAR